jgi:putative transposase
MIPFFIGFFAFLGAFFHSRYNLGIEILALRRLWPAWTHALVIVKPETVVGWHRAGFRLFWRFRSRSKDLGRPEINDEIRALIRQMVKENPSWGAPRIHGELLKLGFEISKRTISNYSSGALRARGC